MGRSFVLLGLMIAASPAPAFAQGAGSGSSVDYTNNVRSQSVGTPGQPTNVVDQYLQRKNLQDLTDTQRAAVSKLGPARAARKDELTAGAPVNDKTGTAMAKIVEVDPDGIVVSMGTARVKVPIEAFGHNKAGLLLDMTRAQFEQVVAQANKAS